jgi:hypothetical protein
VTFPKFPDIDLSPDERKLIERAGERPTSTTVGGVR